MALTNLWSNLIPTDPSAANLLGADIRQDRFDTQERMDASFTSSRGAWSTSGPSQDIIPSEKLTGACSDGAHARRRMLHHTKFQVASQFAGDQTNGGIIRASRSAELYMSIVQDIIFGLGFNTTGYVGAIYSLLEIGQGPEGSMPSIGLFDFVCDPQSLGTVTLDFRSMSYSNTPAVTVLGTATSTNSTGIQTPSSGSFGPVVIQNDTLYYLKLTLPFGARFYGARLFIVTFDDARGYLA